MEMKELREKAAELGLSPEIDVTKHDLIRAIQSAEGNFPCYETGATWCDQPDCAWREDCFTKEG